MAENGKVVAENSAASSEKREPPENLKAYCFQPGQSGNPGGRPKKKPITEMLAKLVEENPEVIATQLMKVFKGKSGMAKVMLLKEAGDRIEGRVTQPLEVNGELTLSIAERMRKARERSGGNQQS